MGNPDRPEQVVGWDNRTDGEEAADLRIKDQVGVTAIDIMLLKL
jgi:hypothetical protein